MPNGPHTKSENGSKQNTDNNISNLEDNFWRDIKKAKSTFIPSHTKLRRKDGTICESRERPYFGPQFKRKTRLRMPKPRERLSFGSPTNQSKKKEHGSLNPENDRVSEFQIKREIGFRILKPRERLQFGSPDSEKDRILISKFKEKTRCGSPSQDKGFRIPKSKKNRISDFQNKRKN